jgi:hypothetical protein
MPANTKIIAWPISHYCTAVLYGLKILKYLTTTYFSLKRWEQLIILTSTALCRFTCRPLLRSRGDFIDDWCCEVWEHLRRWISHSLWEYSWMTSWLLCHFVGGCSTSSSSCFVNLAAAVIYLNVHELFNDVELGAWHMFC